MMEAWGRRAHFGSLLLSRLFIPETSGRSLEGMDELFQLKWWRIGRYGEKDAKARDEEREEGNANEKHLTLDKSAS